MTGTTMEGWLYVRNLLHRISEVEEAFTSAPARVRGCFSAIQFSTSCKPPEFAFAIGDDGPAILEKKTGTWITLMA